MMGCLVHENHYLIKYIYLKLGKELVYYIISIYSMLIYKEGKQLCNIIIIVFKGFCNKRELPSN